MQIDIDPTTGFDRIPVGNGQTHGDSEHHANIALYG